MSDRSTSPAPGVDPATAMRMWHRRRRVAPGRGRAVAPLVPTWLSVHHRADVWRGAVATRLGEELEHWRISASAGTGAAVWRPRLQAVATTGSRGPSPPSRSGAGALGDLWTEPGASTTGPAPDRRGVRPAGGQSAGRAPVEPNSAARRSRGRPAVPPAARPAPRPLGRTAPGLRRPARPPPAHALRRAGAGGAARLPSNRWLSARRADRPGRGARG